MEKPDLVKKRLTRIRNIPWVAAITTVDIPSVTMKRKWIASLAAIALVSCSVKPPAALVSGLPPTQLGRVDSTGMVPEILIERPPPPQQRPSPCTDTTETAGTANTADSIYSPTPIELFIPPLPMPDNVRGFRLVAEFDVSPSGCSTLVGMSRSVNMGYNRRLQSELLKFRFRPGTTLDGTPVRAKAQIVFDFALRPR